MATDIIASTITGGTSNHATTSEEANAFATDFITQGIVGNYTATTGAFAVTQSASPAMTVDLAAGVAYISCTPSGQASQVIRGKMSSAYTAYVIAANTSGSTKYDWIYLKADATTANEPSATADDVITVYTSRSTSNTTDNGTPPTYGLLLAVVTVANAASSIVNANIADKRAKCYKLQSNPYKFSVYNTTNQTLTGLATDTVGFNTETFDTNNNFASSTYTVPISGYYMITGHARIDSTATGYFQLYIAGKKLSDCTNSNSATVQQMNLGGTVFDYFTAGQTINMTIYHSVGGSIIGGVADVCMSGTLLWV